MSIATNATREEKQDWLLRPLNWAWGVSFFGTFYGVFFYAYGPFNQKIVTICLIAALAVSAGLNLWAIRRFDLATKGR